MRRRRSIKFLDRAVQGVAHVQRAGDVRRRHAIDGGVAQDDRLDRGRPSPPASARTWPAQAAGGVVAGLGQAATGEGGIMPSGGGFSRSRPAERVRQELDVEALLAHAEVDVEHRRHGDLERQDERVRDQTRDALVKKSALSLLSEPVIAVSTMSTSAARRWPAEGQTSTPAHGHQRAAHERARAAARRPRRFSPSSTGTATDQATAR